MAEIVYKMAPKAKIGFATAVGGRLTSLITSAPCPAGFPSVPNTQAGFMADVITDDVSYRREPVFADGGVIVNGGG